MDGKPVPIEEIFKTSKIYQTDHNGCLILPVSFVSPGEQEIFPVDIHLFSEDLSLYGHVHKEVSR